jgi:hypothetical protein
MRSLTVLTAFIVLTAALHGEAAEVSYGGGDTVNYVVRESSVGTSIERASVVEKQTPHGTAAMGIAEIVQGAIAKCPAIESVAVFPVLAGDAIGETGTRIQGLGVYAAFSDTSARGGTGSLGGASFLAPFFSLKVTVRTAGAERSSNVFDFNRKLVDPGSLSKTEVLEMPPLAVQKSVLTFAKPRLEAAILELAGGGCDRH